MLRTRIVPWINYEEFECVYHLLFADRKTELDKVKRGIDRVQTWINRGEIPSSVEMTAAFIEIIIRDEQSHHFMSHKELRLAYAMAIVRLVNGLVDREQKGRFAKSINTLARHLGLPSWFVDLRHASTHERLPSLTVLRQGALQAVGWLHDHYWARNIKTAEQKEMMRQNPQIKSKLNQYKECRKNYLKDKYTSKKADPDAYVACIQGLIELMMQDDENEVIQQDIIPSLLAVGGLVPTGKKKRASAEDMNVSKGLIELWTPLLQGLDDGFPQFAEQLVLAIIDKLNTITDFQVNSSLLDPYSVYTDPVENDDPTKAKSYLLTLACWLKHFAKEYEKPASFRTFSHLSLDDLLEGCLRNPSYYTRLVLQVMTTVDPELGQSIKPFIKYIDQMILKYIDEKSNNTHKDTQIVTEDESTYEKEIQLLENQIVKVKSTHHSDTAQQFVQRKKRKLSERATAPEQAKDGVKVDPEATASWKLYKNWKPCPLGTLPNGKVPCLDISLLMQQNGIMEQELLNA